MTVYANEGYCCIQLIKQTYMFLKVSLIFISCDIEMLSSFGNILHRGGCEGGSYPMSPQQEFSNPLASW